VTHGPLKQRILVLALLVAGAAQAELLRDPQWQGWLDAGKTQELERAAQARLAIQPDDAQAAVALAMSALDGAEAQRLEAAQKPVQSCVERQPTLAICHYALGSLQGAQAITGGMMKAISLSGRIKENFSRAVELDPLLYEARSALVEFYLLAPGVAGGSMAKARELAQAAQVRQPEHAKLLRARIAAQDSNWAEVQRELTSVRAGSDQSLQIELRDTWFQLGVQLFGDKQFLKARGVFEQIQRDYPTHANGAYGMGRVLTETGQIDEAIKVLERARTLEGADRLPVDHRLAIALLAKGEKAQAKVALERFVGNKRANPRNLEDARKRLAELG